MRDPAPENIDGEVVHRHAFEHRINWGHVALSLAALVVVAIVLGGSDSESYLESDPSADTESDTGGIA